jgi:predicted TIM-barrel fold metal-dependent hydrolase
MTPPQVVDGDAHVVEGGEFIIQLMEAFPDKLSFPPAGGEVRGALIEGRAYPNSSGPGAGVDAATSLSREASNPFEPHGVLADADREGIDAMVLYPSLGIATTSFRDKTFAREFAQRYNRWLARYCAAAAGRLHGVAVVPLQDVEAAVSMLPEIEDLGLVAVTVPPALRDRNLDHPSLDAFFAGAAAAGLAVSVHGAPGMHVPTPGADRFDNYVQVHCVSFPFDQMVALTALAFGGVLERHPRLRVAFLEAGVGWVPYFVERMDEHFEKRGRQVPGCKRPPSEYVARGQCYFSCEPEEHGIAMACEALGEDWIMYASDYPHWDSDFPHTVAPIRERADLSAETKAKILGGNALRFYGLNGSH